MKAATQPGQDAHGTGKARQERDGLQGVPEGSRNTTAAAVVGGILGRLPEYLWETAGWGGLREWNGRNPVPLPERELRSVFESIARRERGKRGSGGQQAQPPERRETVVRVEIRIGTLGDAEVRSSECSGPPAATHVTVSPSAHAER